MRIRVRSEIGAFPFGDFGDLGDLYWVKPNGEKVPVKFTHGKTASEMGFPGPNWEDAELNAVKAGWIRVKATPTNADVEVLDVREPRVMEFIEDLAYKYKSELDTIELSVDVVAPRRYHFYFKDADLESAGNFKDALRSILRRAGIPWEMGTASREAFLKSVRQANVLMSDHIYDESVQREIEKAEELAPAVANLRMADWDALKLAKEVLAAGRAGSKEEAEKLRLTLVQNLRVIETPVREKADIPGPEEWAKDTAKKVEDLESLLRSTSSNLSKFSPSEVITKLSSIHGDAEAQYLRIRGDLQIIKSTEGMTPAFEKFEGLKNRIIDVLMITSRGARSMLRSIDMTNAPSELARTVREMSERVATFRDIMSTQPYRFDAEARRYRLSTKIPHNASIELAETADLWAKMDRANIRRAFTALRQFEERGILLKNKEVDEIVENYRAGKAMPEKFAARLRVPAREAAEHRLAARRFNIPIRDIYRGKRPGGMHGLVESNVFSRIVQLSDLAEERYLLARDFDEKDRILDAFLDFRVDAVNFLRGEISLEDLNRAIDETEASILKGPGSNVPWIVGSIVVIGIIAYLVWRKR